MLLRVCEAASAELGLSGHVCEVLLVLQCFAPRSAMPPQLRCLLDEGSPRWCSIGGSEQTQLEAKMQAGNNNLVLRFRMHVPPVETPERTQRQSTWMSFGPPDKDDNSVLLSGARKNPSVNLAMFDCDGDGRVLCAVDFAILMPRGWEQSAPRQ